jgi:hypothetical protein
MPYKRDSVTLIEPHGEMGVRAFFDLLCDPKPFWMIRSIWESIKCDFEYSAGILCFDSVENGWRQCLGMLAAKNSGGGTDGPDDEFALFWIRGVFEVAVINRKFHVWLNAVCDTGGECDFSTHFNMAEDEGVKCWNVPSIEYVVVDVPTEAVDSTVIARYILKRQR